jgi:hypothetical protein
LASLDPCAAEFRRRRKTHGADAAENLSAHRRIIAYFRRRRIFSGCGGVSE